ncbi:helix-turn-helix domain-containing protein [Selenihalanaerobacter shriftii]|uniref:PucR family transcriptional regulator n=1 Tax=Selenihalanaerobacter shriftii TaxID=142842 RepID=UPI0022868591|nr:helix-turn-helix domain-containing protein [Selenihalanaerobacter shriftii]
MEWVETLGSFLEEGGSIQKAAERLHIHPNTMSYRIKRIQDILNVNLQDFEVKLNLAIAYKIYKFIMIQDD